MMQQKQFKLTTLDRDKLEDSSVIVEHEIIQQKILKRIFKFILKNSSSKNSSGIHKQLINEMVKFISYHYDKNNGDWEITYLIDKSIIINYWNISEYQENRDNYISISGLKQFFERFLEILQEVNISIDSKILMKGVFTVLGSIMNEDTMYFINGGGNNNDK